MLAKARAKPGARRVRFVRHDLQASLPFQTGSFDRVLCCLVLEHIVELQTLFCEMRRICKPAGRIVISEMHPAMALRGVGAHFHDRESGQDIRPASAANQISDYVMAATRAGLVLEHISEHAVDENLTANSPKARKHVGWPLLLLMDLRRA